jgi:CRP-like cAMP-binding protein
MHLEGESGISGPMNTAERLAVLGRCRVFTRIPRHTLGLLAEMLTPESFGAGSVIWEEGERASFVGFIASGEVRIEAGTKTRTMRAGDVLGEYGMLGGHVRTASTFAETDVVLLCLPYERYREYLFRFPEAMWVLLETAVQRLVESERAK